MPTALAPQACQDQSLVALRCQDYWQESHSCGQLTQDCQEPFGLDSPKLDPSEASSTQERHDLTPPNINPLVICGSARTNGNTAKAVQLLLGDTIPIVHLCEKAISPYDYAYRNAQDDFLPLAQRMALHRPIFFATPVYWYAMSGQMKTFWDRMTDLMYHHKALLQSLTHKPVGLIVSTSHPMPTEFSLPFRATCAYLNLDYQGCWELRFGEDSAQDQAHNASQIQAFSAWWKGFQAS